MTTLFQGTRTYPELRGHIEGISENNFLPENLTLGVIQGIAREYYELYQVFMRDRTGSQSNQWFRKWAEKESVFTKSYF